MATRKRPDEVFERPGFTMIRRGRYLEMKTHRSPDEHKELLRRMRESRPQIFSQIRADTLELETLLQKYTSLDLVASLILRHCILDPNEYKESDSQLRPHWVEHAAIVELKQPRYELRLPLLADSSDLERAHELLEQIFMQTASYYIAEHAERNSTTPPSRIEELRFATLLHGMSVRSPAYSSHCRDLLLGLFQSGSAAEYLNSSHNLDVRMALASVDAIETHIAESIQGRIEQARHSGRDFWKQLKDYQATGIFKGESYSKELFDLVRNMRAKDAKRYLEGTLSEWIRVALGTVLSFGRSDCGTRHITSRPRRELPFSSVDRLRRYSSGLCFAVADKYSSRNTGD